MVVMGIDLCWYWNWIGMFDGDNLYLCRHANQTQATDEADDDDGESTCIPGDSPAATLAKSRR